nr:hypothetical protein Iba_chr01dCG14270 [Ipomoea batatas]
MNTFPLKGQSNDHRRGSLEGQKIHQISDDLNLLNWKNGMQILQDHLVPGDSLMSLSRSANSKKSSYKTSWSDGCSTLKVSGDCLMSPSRSFNSMKSSVET